MRHDTVTYFNGKRYMRRVRSVGGYFIVPRRAHTFITFAYRGIPDEWPVIISYTIR